MKLISIFDLSHAEIEAIIEKGKELKRERKEGVRARNDLESKTLAMIFEKPSTRTRVSFEVAMRELGGCAGSKLQVFKRVHNYIYANQVFQKDKRLSNNLKSGEKERQIEL